MPSTLDHNFYPHLFETIISLSDYATKIALRPVSRAVQARVDPDIFAHISIRSLVEDELDGKPLDFSRKDPAPIELGSPYGGLPWRASSLAQVRDEFGERAALVRVLDVSGWFTPDENAVATAAFPNVETMRRRNNGYDGAGLAVASATTFVEFVSITGDNDSREFKVGEIAGGDTNDEYAIARIVVNIVYDPTYEGLHVEELKFEWAKDEMVFLFTPTTGEEGGEETANVDVPVASDDPKYSFIRDIFETQLRYFAGESSFYLVGVTEMDRRLLGLDVALTDDDTIEVLRDVLRELAAEDEGDDALSADEVEKRIALMHFPTVAEYRAGMSDAQWELESSWDTAEPMAEIW